MPLSLTSVAGQARPTPRELGRPASSLRLSEEGQDWRLRQRRKSALGGLPLQELWGGVGKHLAGLPGQLALGSAMRSVSYVQRVALEFSGSLFPHAICLGDVDNDTVSACALQVHGRGGAREEEACGAHGACAVGLAWRSWARTLPIT